MRRRRSKVSSERDHFNPTSVQSDCISHDYGCYNWMSAIRHCGLVYLCHTRISMWLLFFVTAEWQRWWAIVSRAAQCLWADHSWSSDLKAANGDLTTRISQGCMMVFERSILSILSCSRIVKHQLVLREFPSNSTNVSNSPWESALYCFILGSFNWSGLGAAILSHIRSNHFILTFTNVLSDACQNRSVAREKPWFTFANSVEHLLSKVQ